MRAKMDLLEVSAANAAGGHLDEEFAGTNARNGHGFDAHVVDAVIDNGAHGGRDPGFCNVVRV